ncbi:MAG: hypothetical protein QOD99_371 [Chthoniobacter sp.]|jgi:hypothetical protein|nr:hypothetical protein [Chthoniobacter sp.]
MFEHRRQPLLSRAQYFERLARNAGFALIVTSATLGIGVVGYHALDGLAWIDALLNASMILGGMGPVDALRSDAAKVFASFYALFSGLVFIGIAALLFAPMVHRLMHRFHLETEDDAPSVEKK